MPAAPTRWIKRLAERRPKEEWALVPRGTRGLYVLLRHEPGTKYYDVVYVGLSRSGVQGRLRKHSAKKKKRLWTHFSVFEVFDNVKDDEIEELEGLFRHAYSRDAQANRLNVQKTHRPFKTVRADELAHWGRVTEGDAADTGRRRRR